ncbi:MAG: glycosyltransferase [Candidatus Gracilibacteria bacterium]
MPKISIITTAYKHEKFIAQTIDSILNQSFSDWELLIGDDSPDNATWQIIEQYTKKYPDKIRAWHHSPNKGIVDNMNFLIKHIAPETHYVSFLEGDDMYTPDNLEKKMSVFKEMQSLDIIYTDFLQINEKSILKSRNYFLFTLKNKSRFLPRGMSRLSVVNLLGNGNPIQSFGSVIITKKVIDDFFPVDLAELGTSMFGPFDYFLWLKIFPGKEVFHLDKPLFLYRVHSGNFVKNINVMLEQSQQLFSIIRRDYFRDRNVTCICDDFINECRMLKAFSDGDMKKFRSFFFMSWRYNLKRRWFVRVMMYIGSYIPKKGRDAMRKLYSLI